MKVQILTPYGFCPGVQSAIDRTAEFLEANPEKKVYLFHPLVHNERINQRLKQRYANLFDYRGETLDSHSALIFSAHGRDEKAPISGADYQILDCLCPLLEQRFALMKKKIEAGYRPFYLGKLEHPESRATIGYLERLYPGFAESFDSPLELESAALLYKNVPILIVVQSTLNIDLEELKKRLEKAFIIPSCHFSSNRWARIANLPEARTIVVVGSTSSSNTRELFEAAKLNRQASVFLVQDLEELKARQAEIVEPIAVASGTSAAAEDVDEIACYLKDLM